MRYIIGILLAAAMTAGLAFAFGSGPIRNEGDSWQAIPLPTAYDKAMHSLGIAANDYFCIEAKHDYSVHGWDMTFIYTNSSKLVLRVYDWGTVTNIIAPK
jgi:hypothetical protein